MSAERFLDDLARTLAEPMPRRRAVRVIGVSLAALAVPGVSPALARASAAFGSDAPPSCPGQRICSRNKDPQDYTKGQEHKCCPYPIHQYSCGRDGFTCVDECKLVGQTLGKKTVPTWSAEKYADGRPKRYNCCVVPDSEPRDGDCVPSCAFLMGPGAHRCRNGCCPRTQRCVRSTGECKNCPRERPIVCGSECCDRAEEECLNVASEWSSNVRRPQCVEKCAPGKRRCIASNGQLGECCPSGYPCCGVSCGCDGRTECVRVSRDDGIMKVCLPKCRPPESRCNSLCCRPERMYQGQHPDGRRYCRCRR